jgi:hypothetical protein
MVYSHRNTGAWGTSHGQAPAFNTSSELQIHLAGVNWADVVDTRANSQVYDESSLDTNLQPMGSGYYNAPTNPHILQATELQHQQSVNDIARQLRAEQSIDLFSERAPWFPGARVPVRCPSARTHALLTTTSLTATCFPNCKKITPTAPSQKANTSTMQSRPAKLRPPLANLHDPVHCRRTHGQHLSLATPSHPHRCRLRKL